MSDFKNLPTVNGVAVSLVSHSHSYQPLDTELTAFAALVSAADKLPYFDGAGTMALADFTAFGRSLAAAADAAAGRTALGLGTAAVIADNTLVHIAGAETITGAKTFSADIIAATIRQAVETGGLTLLGGTSITQGPYIQMGGKDGGTSNDGNIISVATTESSASGESQWWYYNGGSYIHMTSLVPATQTWQHFAPNVAHGLITIAPTTMYGSVGPTSLTAGGMTMLGMSDTDAAGMLLWAIMGTINPTDSLAAMLFRADKSNGGTSVAALGAAETAFAWNNSGTKIMSLLGNGDLFMISGSKLVTETIQAIDATGLVFKDDAAATYGVLEDGGNWGFGGITNPNVMVHLQRAASGQDLKLQQFDATNDYARVVLHDSADNYLFGFETGSGTHRHTFADGFVPANDYAAAYTSAANPLYFGTNDLVQLALLSSGASFFGLNTGLANILGIRAGASTVTNDAAVGGVILVNTTQTASDTNVMGILASYTVPANTLAVNGQSIWFEASGTLTNGASLAGFQVRFGSQAFLSSETMGGVTTNGFFNIRGRIIRTGAATQKGYVTHTLINTGGAKTDARYKAFTLTLSSANDLTIRHETDLTAGDIVLETFVVGWDDANV